MQQAKKKGRRGPLPGYTKDKPFHPERVLDMFRMRQEGATITQIGAKFGITPAGAAHNLNRWANWAKGKL
jgi:hypothetical protein